MSRTYNVDSVFTFLFRSLGLPTLTASIIAAVAWGGSASQLMAATFTWANAGGGNWSVTSNWNGGVGPAPTGTNPIDVIQFLTDASYTSTLNIAGSPPFELTTLELGGDNAGFSGNDTRTLTRAGTELLNISNGGSINLTANASGQAGTDFVTWNVNVPLSLDGNLVLGGNNANGADFNFTQGLSFNSAATTITTNTNRRANITGTGPMITNSLSFDGAGTGGPTIAGAVLGAAAVTIDVTGSSLPQLNALGQSVVSTLTKTGNGVLTLDMAATYSGGSNINGGKLRALSSGNNFVFGIGSGPININSATLSLAKTGHFNSNDTFTNAINVNASGGTIEFAHLTNGNFTNWILNGGGSFAGNVAITTADAFNDLQSVSFSGAISLPNSIQITNSTATNATVAFTGSLSGSSSDLTLATGGQYTLLNTNATGSNLNIRNVNLNSGRLNLGNASLANSDDPLATIRANGGKVTLANNTSLALARGTFLLSDFVTGNNVDLLAPLSGAQNHATTVRTTAPGQALVLGSNGTGTFRNFTYLHGQNVDFVVQDSTSAISTLSVRNGATFSNSGTNNGDLFATLQFLNDSTFSTGNSTSNLTVQGGTGVVFGNGTASSVTITGNNAHASSVFNLGSNGAPFTVNANTTLNYASNTSFGLRFGNSGFLEGTAGTTFNMASGTTLRAMAATANIFTATNDVVLAGPGTVSFLTTANANGNVQISSDLSGIGTMKAANVTFNGGSISPGLSAGTLTIDGNLILSSTTDLNFELNSPGIAGMGVNDLIAVTGNLTLAGNINLVGTPADGTYTLFTYSGSLTTGLITLPTNAMLDTSTAGLVLLTYTMPAPEPGSGLLVVGLLPLASAYRKRRREVATV